MGKYLIYRYCAKMVEEYMLPESTSCILYEGYMQLNKVYFQVEDLDSLSRFASTLDILSMKDPRPSKMRTCHSFPLPPPLPSPPSSLLPCLSLALLFPFPSHNVISVKKCIPFLFQIRYASVNRLMERLTDVRFLSVEFLNTFLTTYSVFSNAIVILEALIQFYYARDQQDIRKNSKESELTHGPWVSPSESVQFHISPKGMLDLRQTSNFYVFYSNTKG